MDISIVVPAFNEGKNILPLYYNIKKSLERINKDYEIIIVDDGSTDNTEKELSKINDPCLVSLKLPKNTGQSNALQQGIAMAKGNIITTLDADLQNDPEDIKKMLPLLKDYDAVVGHRKDRKDPLLKKKIPSKIFNIMVKLLFRLSIHDCSCTLKTMKKEAAKSLILKPGYHRLIPILLQKEGFSIKEIEVKHHPRKYENAKYNSPLRFIEGIKDLIYLKLR